MLECRDRRGAHAELPLAFLEHSLQREPADEPAALPFLEATVMKSDSSDRPRQRTTIPIPKALPGAVDRILEGATVELAVADGRSPTVDAHEASPRSRRKSGRATSRAARSRRASLKQRKKQMGRIIDQLQVLVLRRPHWLDFVEDMLDGLLRGIHHDDEDNSPGAAR